MAVTYLRKKKDGRLEGKGDTTFFSVRRKGGKGGEAPVHSITHTGR